MKRIKHQDVDFTQLKTVAVLSDKQELCAFLDKNFPKEITGLTDKKTALVIRKQANALGYKARITIPWQPRLQGVRDEDVREVVIGGDWH